MTPSVPWVRKTGWTDPIYIALEGGEQMQKYLSLSSPVLCPTVPWLDHKGLADGTRGFCFFFFPLFDLVAPFSGLDFSLSQCDLLSVSSSLWNSLLLLFPWGDGEQIARDLLPQSCAHFLRWCCWAFRGAGLSQQTHLTAACVHFSHSSYDPIQCGSCLQEWTSTVTRCWKGPPYLLDQPYENPFYIQIFICSHEKIKADPLQSPEALDNRGW